MKKKICGEIWGYVIRHPGEGGPLRYIFGDSPQELEEKYYEGFNPVCALVRLDKGRLFDPDALTEEDKIK